MIHKFFFSVLLAKRDAKVLKIVHTFVSNELSKIKPVLTQLVD